MALNDTSSDDPKVQRSWRQFIAGAVSMILLAGAFCFFWAQGDVPGMSGVALASDLNQAKIEMSKRQDDLESKQDRGNLLMLRSAIRQALIDQCTAAARKNGLALNLANATLYDLIDQFRELAHHDPLLPKDCSVILIVDKP